MKKIFSLCSAIAMVLTGLTCCGGGGDDTAFVTADKFRSGTGLQLIGNPTFVIEPGFSRDAEWDWPTLPDGTPATPDFTIPGSGSEEIPDDPATPDVDEFEPARDPEQLHPTGKQVTVYRDVSAGRNKYSQAALVTYCMTKENIGVAKFSFDQRILEDENLINGMGISFSGGNNNNWNNNNNQAGTLDRISMSSLAAVNVTIYYNFNNAQATVMITASGVSVQEGDNEAYTAEVVVLTANSVTFGVKK